LQRRKHVMPACAQCSLHENRITESVDPSNTMISWSIWPSTSEVDAVASSTLFGACLLVSYIICTFSAYNNIAEWILLVFNRYQDSYS
jgi:hypothetical protein